MVAWSHSGKDASAAGDYTSSRYPGIPSKYTSTGSSYQGEERGGTGRTWVLLIPDSIPPSITSGTPQSV